MKAPTKTIMLRKQNGEDYMETTGRIIKFKGFEDIEFILHKTDNSENPTQRNLWRITEVETGGFLGHSYRSPNEALREAKLFLTKVGRDTLLKKRDEYLALIRSSDKLKQEV